MIRYLLANLRHRRRRMALTVLGIVIGTTLIMSLLLVSGGLERAVAGQLQSFGSDLLLVFPGKEDNPFLGLAANLELRDKDIDAIRSVDGVRLVMPMDSETMKVEFEGEEKSTLIHGSPWEETRIIFEESKGLGLADGRWPESDGALEAVIGSAVAADRFGSTMRVGDIFGLRGRRYEVAGILKPTGSSEDDSIIYLSMDRFRLASGDPSGVGGAILKVEAGRDAEEVAARVRERLLEQKGVEDFVVLTPGNVLRIVGGVLGVIRLILGGIAGVALLVGGVGIMNTMFTAVLERTREIGVLKALGAKNRRVLTMFLAEAGALGAIGGAIGAVLAAGIGELVELAAEAQGFPLLQVSLDPLLMLGVLAFTFALGTIFGAVPAWQAAKLKPTEALRYE